MTIWYLLFEMNEGIEVYNLGFTPFYQPVLPSINSFKHARAVGELANTSIGMVS
jgi:hypothetical protein